MNAGGGTMAVKGDMIIGMLNRIDKKLNALQEAVDNISEAKKEKQTQLNFNFNKK